MKIAIDQDKNNKSILVYNNNLIGENLPSKVDVQSNELETEEESD